MKSCLRAVVAAVFVSAASAAVAHDTWFHHLGARAGATLLALGTGNRFPLQELGVAAEFVRASGCRDADARAVALTPLQNLPRALLLRAAANEVTTCWAQLPPFEVELPPDKVAVYLDEIDAPRAVRNAWAEMQARGVRWRERYTKHARVELRGGSTLPTGMAMDLLLASGAQTIRPGDALVFQLLSDGRPLAGMALELRGELDASWHKTDAQGRLRVPAPPAGRWLLRGTELRLSESERDRWESRFVTLAFEVEARPGS